LATATLPLIGRIPDTKEIKATTARFDLTLDAINEYNGKKI